MIIKNAQVIALSIPFKDGGQGTGLMPRRWDHLHMALLRLEDERGHTGWGEAFCYFSQKTVATAIREMVVPLIVDQNVEDIAAFSAKIQQRLHLFGRFGITMFAISALDIALWDLKAKRQNLPLASLLGGTQRTRLPAYASLVRYGDPGVIAEQTANACAQGYAGIKLHEIEFDCIAAGRDACGSAMPLATDVNCNWSLEEARSILPRLKELGLYWVEEPVFPCDDEITLQSLQDEFGVSIASGENACTAIEFKRLDGAIRFIQPSVTKVGGISEFLAISRNNSSGIMPHSPYFGPGYWATAHLMAANPASEMFEFLYVQPETWLSSDMPLPEGGSVTLPAGPGLGFDPDTDVLKTYEVAF